MQCAFNIFNSINPPRLALCMIKTFGLVVRIFPEGRGAAASEMSILSMTRHVSTVSARASNECPKRLHYQVELVERALLINYANAKQALTHVH